MARPSFKKRRPKGMLFSHVDRFEPVWGRGISENAVTDWSRGPAPKPEPSKYLETESELELKFKKKKNSFDWFVKRNDGDFPGVSHSFG